MARGLIERRTIVVVLSLLLLASGTPQVLARDAARDALVATALAAPSQQPIAAASPSTGVPPTDDQYRAMTLPTPSGANPLYPANHTFDADPQLVGTPPANHDIEVPGYPVGLPPANYDLEAPSHLAGTPPTNHDFELGSLTGWTTSGSVTLASDPLHGAYAQLGSGGIVTTDAFTVDPATQAVLVELGFLASGSGSVAVRILSGSGYTTVSGPTTQSCSGCTGWETRALDVSAFGGQSIKLAFQRNTGTIGVDAVRGEVLFPDYETTGGIGRVSEPDGNDYATVANGATFTSSPFVVDGATRSVAVRALDRGPGGQFWITVLSGPTFATATRVHINTNAPDAWEKIAFTASQWQGQTIKLRIEGKYRLIGVDDLGTQRVELPNWTITDGDAWLETESANTYVVASNDTVLTSSAFTLDAAAQQLTLRYRGETAGATFYPELLRGPGFTEVVPLTTTYVAAPSTVDWTTLTLGVTLQAGEPVKLRLRAYLGRMQYDDVGVVSAVVPGWTLTANHALAVGSDPQGTWIRSLGSSATIRSSALSTGLIDRVNEVDQRYYAISYDVGYSTGEMVRVTWVNPATSQTRVVFQDAENAPTGYLTRYFWVADFMGTDGCFEVLVPGEGKLYSIADNIPRQHLNEPFSEHVGVQIDTSTGSFGYQAQDLSTQGIIPLIFARYYAAHADQFGPLGYRWTHSYDTRLEIDASGDTGVVLGSGRELFYDWDTLTLTFTATDVRIHDRLVKHGDGTNTFSTTTHLDYHFTSAGVLTSISDPNGNSVTLTYDGSGRLTIVADPVGRELDLTYDTNGRLDTVTDPVGAVVTYGYDANGDLTTVTDPELDVWSYAYDRHWLVEVTGPDQVRVFANTLDDHDRVVTQTLADDATVTIQYATPSAGVTSVTDPEGNTARFYFDRFGRTTHKVDPLGYVTEYQYDGDGNRVRVIDPANNQWNFAYDGAGNLTSFTDSKGNPVSIGYDPEHLPTTVADADGKVTTLAYDAYGNVSSATDPLNRTTSRTYDLLGRTTSATDPCGVSVGYGYDDLGNLTSSTYPGGSITYAYDDLSRRTSMVDRTGTTTWTYNAAGQVTAIAAPQGTVAYGHDAVGQRTSMTLPGGRAVTYAYDAAGQLTSLTDWQQRTTGFTYDTDGRRTGITRPNGVNSVFSYNAIGQLTGIDHSGTGCACTLQSFAYGYDAVGNRTSVTTAAGTESYIYDALNRLTAVTYANADTEAFNYDPNGNRLTYALNGVTLNTYVYDAADQLTSDGAISYTYDQAGNLLSAGADSYGWDWKSRLTSATVGGVTTTYAYDGDDVRVSQTTGGMTTWSLWDRESGLPLLVDDGSNAYLHAGGVQAQIDGAGTASYPLADGLGSVRGLTDASGAVTGTADYAAFGAVRSQSGASSLFGFTGEQTDPSGQLYLRARTYDPALGRFTSADTVQPNAPGSQGYNRYVYTANNPTTWTDPTGHVAQSLGESDIWTVGANLVNAVLLYALYSIQQASREVVVSGSGSAMLSVREGTRLMPLVRPMIAAIAGLTGGGLSFLFGPEMVSRAIGAAIFVISMALALTMLYVIFKVFVLLDPFDFFPDTRAPSEIIEYTSETISSARWYYPNSPQYRNCSTGTMVGGAAEEYIWGTALGVLGGGGGSTEDILFAAGMACFSGGNGGSGDGPPKPPKLDLNKLSPGLEKRLQKVLEQEGSDIHALKAGIVGRKNMDLFDLYVDKKTGDIFLMRRGGIGEPQPTGWNRKQLLR